MKSLWTIILVLTAASGCGSPETSIVELDISKSPDSMTELASDSVESATQDGGVVAGGSDPDIVKELADVPIELSPRCIEAGLSKTIVKKHVVPFATPAVIIYFRSQAPFIGRIHLIASNGAGQEIGRFKQDVVFEADDGKYVTFAMPGPMDLKSVEKLLVDIRSRSTNPLKKEDQDSTTPDED